MTRRLASRLVAGSVLAALLSSVAGTARGEPVDWGRAFGAVADTAIFLGEDGALWRAPFHLATRETLWAPRGGERIARLRVSPDGRHYAFTTRIAEEDTTWIWVGGPEPPRRRGNFASLMPYRWGHLHFEPAMPTVKDRGFRGARFLQVGTRKWIRSSNALEWLSDGRGVIFPYNDGLAYVDANDGPAVQVSRALPMELLVLDPSPVVLVNAVVLREDLRQRMRVTTPNDEERFNPALQGQSWYLLFPGFDRWRAFSASGLESGRLWTASENTVWWVSGKGPGASAGTIRAVRAHDPTPTREIHGRDAVTWLRHSTEAGGLLWIAGRTLIRRPDSGGRDTVWLEARTPLVWADLAEPDRVVVASQESLWVLRGDRRWAASLGGFAPRRALPGPGGELLLAGGGEGAGPPRLARVDLESHRVETIGTPEVKNGEWAVTPGGTHLVLVPPASRPASTVNVYDRGTRAWIEVMNPGITGWEEIRGR